MPSQADKMARTRDEMDKVACAIAQAKADEELAQLNQKRAVLAAKETEERVQKFLTDATKVGKAGELQELDGLKAAVKDKLTELAALEEEVGGHKKVCDFPL
jgi:hypothetical protein